MNSGNSLGSTLKLYPNPATEKVRLDGLPFGIPVVFTNTLGQRFEKNIQQEGEIDISDLPPGLFKVEARFEGKIYRQTFIVFK